MRAIYLTGFMGSGKTTIAEKLSKALDMPAIDTDQHIMKATGKSIPDIFANEGEAAFRQYETESLEALPTENVIISTGGGIVLKERNRRFMEQNGTVIYLHCETEEIIRRLEGDTSRPLLAGDDRHEKVRLIFDDRLSLYREAKFEVNTTHQPISDIVTEIRSVIG
ncbi:MAG: shikimate kinase [Anaerobacillus sp.]